MTNFLAGFKCPPQHGGEAQMRNNLIGELACDILMGESSPLYARLYSQGLINDSFGSSRIRIWRAVWAAFRERPWLGTGAGTLSHRIDITFSRFVPETGETLRENNLVVKTEFMPISARLIVNKSGYMFKREQIEKLTREIARESEARK